MTPRIIFRRYSVDEHGLGRGFISRDMLMSTSFDDAIARASVKYASGTGHNIQVMEFAAPNRIANVEVAPFQELAITYIAKGTPPFFHANAFLKLNVPQDVSTSSVHREARVKELPAPKTFADLLNVLGDQEDQIQPIFHDAISKANGDKSGDLTLATILFNVLEGTATMYHDNPKLQHVARKWDI